MADENPGQHDLAEKVELLQRELRRLQDFSELSTDWFWEQDADLRFVGFSGISTEKLRRKQSDFIGKLRWEVSLNGVSKVDMDGHIHCCEQHQPFRDFEYDIVSDSGENQRYSISGTPIFNEQGEFSGYHGVGRNITELRAAQLEVEQSQRKLSQILRGSPIPTFVLDADHCVSHWNQACENLTGIAAEEMIGSRDSWRGFYTSKRPTMANLVVSGASDIEVSRHYGGKFSHSALIKGAYEGENYFPHMRDGGRWIYFNASPLLDAAGNTVGAIETLQDITARKLAEQAERENWQQLQQAHAELQTTMTQLVEAKKLAGLGRLVAGVAHELNTPLGNALMVTSSIQSLMEGLKESYQASNISRSTFANFLEQGEDALSLLEQSVKRSSLLVSRFRELADDQRHYEVVVFSPFEMVQDMLQMSASEIKAKSVTCTVVIDRSIMIKGYPDAFLQIVFSLMENSLIHGVDVGGSIALSAQRHGDEIDFVFRDDGRGMVDEVIAQAFDPFFSTSFGQGGSGLGLYRVYNLVTVVCGGKIELSSDTNEGLSVIFSLPLSV
ncbi:MAG: PAS domain-containing sensor histidine kinase [Motiliproteus sp.]